MTYALIDGHESEQLAEWVGELHTSVMKLARFQRSRVQRDGRALPFALLSMLSLLEAEGPMTPTRLAELSGVRKPSVTRSLAALTQAGLVHSAADARDGRQVVVFIADVGRAALNESEVIVDDWYRDLIARLPVSDREHLRRAVAALDRLQDTGGTVRSVQ
jgi:DNA-binding MarR family transcriptional regulator